MVDVRVSEENRLDVLCLNGERLPVALSQSSGPLEHPGIDQETLVLVGEIELGTCHGAGSTQEL